MTEDITRMIADYERSCNALADAFLNKQFNDPDEPPITIEDSKDAFWFGGDAGDAVVYGEQVFAFNDIITDLYEDAPIGEIIKYNDYHEYCYDQSITPINYRAWLHGAPRFNNKVRK